MNSGNDQRWHGVLPKRPEPPAPTTAAEYRIKITHEPGDLAVSYRAQVFNLAGDWQHSEYGKDAATVEQRAREWVERASGERDRERELWVDGAGRDAVAPPSTTQTLADVAPRLVERLKGGDDASA